MDSSYTALANGEDGQKNEKDSESRPVEEKWGSKVVALLDDKSRWIEEAKALWSLAWPIALAGMANYSFLLVTVTFVGHLGELELSSAAIAFSVANVTGFNVMLGMALGVETLCGQAYGAKDYTRLGVHLQAAVIVTLLACIPIGILWWNLEIILVWSGQDLQISRMAASYLSYTMPGLVASAVHYPFVRYLQVQSEVKPMLVCSVITAVLHVLVCYFLIFTLGFGHVGGALANSFSNWLFFILLASYTAYSGKCNRTWTGFRFREAVRNIPLFAHLAVPSVILVCLRLWTFEIQLLLSGRLPNPELELSLFAIALNTTSFMFMIAFGFRAAGCTRVSYALGANLPEDAKIASHVLLVSIAAIYSIVFILLILTRNWLGFLFTNVEEVALYVAQVVPILAITIFTDAMQGAFIGILGGGGRQKLGAVVNLGAYYGFGIPFGFVLAFPYHLNGTILILLPLCKPFPSAFGAHVGNSLLDVIVFCIGPTTLFFAGLLIGLTCGISLQVMIMLFYVLRTNWNKWADDTQTRVQRGCQEQHLPTHLERLLGN